MSRMSLVKFLPLFSVHFSINLKEWNARLDWNKKTIAKRKKPFCCSWNNVFAQFIAFAPNCLRGQNNSCSSKYKWNVKYRNMSIISAFFCTTNRAFQFILQFLIQGCFYFGQFDSKNRYICWQLSIVQGLVIKFETAANPPMCSNPDPIFCYLGQ